MTELIYKCDRCKKQIDTQDVKVNIRFKGVKDTHFCSDCGDAFVPKLMEFLESINEQAKPKRKAGRPKKKIDTQDSVSKPKVQIEPLDDLSELDFSDGVDAEISELARELAKDN